jgi:sterol desaturase/sphingolipid hydroxylase (fatty acid hydroxylase superfamily)
MEFPQTSEALIRFGIFFSVLVVLAGLETLFPRRARRVPRDRRWPSNIGVSALNQAFVRLMLPTSAIALAITSEQNEWGLFGQVTLVPWIEILATILILDLAIYLQHRAYHAVPVLWRFHRMHHADVEFDVTTGIRFHPVSVLLSGFIKLAVVFVIGPAPAAVLAFEVLLNATSLFNHSNLRIPEAFDWTLRLLVVTPDMHRIHHSIDADETNRNFGFNFPWWDRLFNSYRAKPATGHRAMLLGLDEFREEREFRLDRMLSQPFRGSDFANNIDRN